ncbi:MAG TPA: biopolymer transporter ExbD [Polyangiaceae bacterium]|nr:biopolymer transporter ExbD [Polyangiaceae bacterium]
MGATVQATKSKGATPEINITPLVDVVLVLLIIFMVVTPAINEGAQIELPKVLMPDPKQKDLHPIEVTIAPDGTTVVEKENIAFKDLKATLVKLHEKDPARSLMLKSDETMKWGKMRNTFLDLQNIGFKGVLLKVVAKKTAADGV